MTTDNLTVFGTDFTGVTGIKASGTGNGTLTYIRPQGTKSISANGTGIDVTEFAAVDVAVPTGTPRTSTDLTVSGDTVTAPAGYYASAASKSVASGTAGTPTATKGSVSNHSVSVTPSVTNTTGYITGGTKTGTAVTVSASELVSGTYTVDSSGTKDVTNYASVSVPALTLPTAASSTSSGTSKATITPGSTAQYINIPTGYNGTAQYYTVSAASGGSVATETKTLSAASTSIQFTSLSGQPKAFCLRITSQLTRSSGSSNYYVTMVRYDGTNTRGNYWRMSNGTYYNDTTHYSYSYSNGTLTVSSSASQTSAGGAFYAGGYELVYVY